MNIYFVRHGESEGNAKKVTQSKDTPLSAKGKKQATALAKRLKNIDIDFIYTSHLKRTRQTAEIISKEVNKPIKLWEDLQEMRQPTERENLQWDDEENQKIIKLINEHYYEGNWKYSDEETFDELKARCQKVMDDLLKNHKDKNVLCVTHGGVIRMIATLAIFGEDVNAWMFYRLWHHTWHENTGITQIDNTEKYGWVLMTWNDTTHL